MVSSLGKGMAEALLSERDRAGPYASVEVFARRNRFERIDAEALVGSGAFDSLLAGQSRAQALMTLLSICASREGAVGAPRELFAIDGRKAAGARRRGSETPGHAPPQASSRKRRAAELKYLGTTLDSHPLELWPRAFAASRDRAVDLRRSIGCRVRLLGWPITAKPVLTAQEEVMEFVSFEDETAIIEAVLFPDAYRKFRHLLFDEGPLWITGLAENNRGAVSLTIENLARA